MTMQGYIEIVNCDTYNEEQEKHSPALLLCLKLNIKGDSI